MAPPTPKAIALVVLIPATLIFHSRKIHFICSLTEKLAHKSLVITG
ncbi:hypothetical protein I8751_08045 [Nostocaceae cyanobacterium CENA357]|uniref:Uncharacterized protein n=1 Tax=Atlanticothrix silvestris CENA357 TaxID=1725252 RepID=A0A8J7HGR6_9CYAN|nr:hypothetical protein [Atlanticothrix silvestris]MBH8552325.1 hypothetical protein [Atlanticothrix silvestris CENA357]